MGGYKLLPRLSGVRSDARRLATRRAQRRVKEKRRWRLSIQTHLLLGIGEARERQEHLQPVEHHRPHALDRVV